MEQKIVDLTKKETQFELASVKDADLMKILCYAVTEGKNVNGAIFPRTELMASYRTLIDKPVVIVPDKFNNPTTHGYDYKKKAFMNDKRVNIGHIVDAQPVIVTQDGEVHNVYSLEDLNAEELKDGELRIITTLVIYKHYLYDIAERLKLLHELGNLSFSMESVVDSYEGEDGSRICSNISFTGLAIVDKPAFAKAKSIEVAGQKEDEDFMEFKEMYEAEVKKNTELTEEINKEKANSSELANQIESLQNEISEIKEELANSKKDVASAQAEVESLKPFKEQVQIAEKAKLGEERVAKLEKFGVKDADANELAEMSKEDFADKLVEAAENMTVEMAEEHELYGLPVHNTSTESDMKRLMSLLTVK